jgi:peroxiredoxin Q/BCP
MTRFAFALAVALAVGQAAPDFKLLDQNGTPISLSAARGHKVVLVFYRGYW